jgi:hypothetical protein
MTSRDPQSAAARAASRRTGVDPLAIAGLAGFALAAWGAGAPHFIDYDSVQFALATVQPDLRLHHPQPPGYVFYVEIAGGLTRLLVRYLDRGESGPCRGRRHAGRRLQCRCPRVVCIRRGRQPRTAGDRHRDAGTPSIVGTANTPGFAWDVAVDGSRAYIADESYGLQAAGYCASAAPPTTRQR